MIEHLKAAKEEAEVRHRVELDAYKKLYDKAVEMLSAKIAGEPEVEEETEESGEPEVEEEPVDINICDEATLRGLGLSAYATKNVVASRPFRDMNEVRAVPGITQITFRLIESKITLGSVEEEKREPVNVNRAGGKEISEKTGVPLKTAYRITAYRKQNGLFKNKAELLMVPAFGKRTLEKYGDLLEV